MMQFNLKWNTVQRNNEDLKEQRMENMKLMYAIKISALRHQRIKYRIDTKFNKG